MSLPQNAIVRRLGSLTRKWDKLSQDEGITTCIWSVKDDEIEMIEAFYEVEVSEEGKTLDIFLKFSSPYADHNEYTKALSGELNEIITSSGEQMIDEGIEPDDLKLQKSTSNPAIFLKNLEAFSQLLDIEGNVVAFISPEKNANIPAWVDWLMRANAYKATKIKIMLVQLERQPVFDKLLNYPPAKGHKIIPDLNMEEAVTELAAQGNPQDPATKFRKLYVAMLQAASKSNLSETERLANEALKLTRKNGLKLLEATVFLVLGGVFLNKKKRKKGLHAYDDAIQVLKSEKKEPELAKQQLNMAYLSKGMALLQMKKYDLAASCYELAAGIANELVNDFMEMDAWRMAGTCYLKTTLRKSGEDCLRKSLEAGMRLDEKMRRDTTMPFAAMELFYLESTERRAQFDVAMKKAIGQDWQALGSIKNRSTEKANI